MTETTGWQKIETAPKDGSKILVPYPLWENGNYTNTPDTYQISIVHWNGVGWDAGGWMLHESVTHWMPLPALPEPPK